MNFFERFKSRRTFLLAFPVALLARRTAAAASPPPVPGSAIATHSAMLDMAAKAIQVRRPVDAMSAYLNGFHFYANDVGRQVQAHHFCTHINEDFHQCVIYDSNESNAKLIGIEYIVSERVYASLPPDEQRLWHSHHYEVKSGELIAPGVPELAERDLMQTLVTTYGKTWHTWQIDRSPRLPLGIPQLMMGFTADGQVQKSMLAERDSDFHVSTAERKSDRAGIPTPSVNPHANAWQSGKVMQLKLTEVAVEHRRS